MIQETYPIQFWDSPQITEIGGTIEEFLEQFDEPTWIYIPGRDNSRCRVITTLLHGNEPSGLHAVHRWLRSDDIPATDLYCFIGAPQAAQNKPLFHCRMLPGHRDLNRCFRPPFTDAEGHVAADLLHRICAVKPEAVIDIHNTSGAGPSFAIATDTRNEHKIITALFTPRLIITDLKLGALMEFDTEPFTITTIECGGAHDPQAHELAYEGFKRFAKQENLFTHNAEVTIDLYTQPIRVELAQEYEMAFAYEYMPGADLILHSDIERYNFNVAQKDTHLGWLGPAGMACLVARDAHGNDHTQHFFEVRDNELVTKQNVKLFMVTKNIDIAMSDCLFYVVPIDEPGHFEHIEA